MVTALISAVLGICLANTAGLFMLMLNMNSRFAQMDSRMDGLGNSVNARIDALAARLDARLDSMDQRLRVVEARPS